MGDKEKGKRLRAARIAAGYKTAGEFAQKELVEHRISTESYRAHEAGRRGFARHADLYAKLLNVAISDLFMLDSVTSLPKSGVIVAKCMGEVEAGVWKESVELQPSEQLYEHFPDPEQGFDKYTCLLISGDSMDKFTPHGTKILCVDIQQYEASGRLPKTGNFVIVRRKKNDLVENTIKQLEIRDGEYWLWPRSSNPKYQQPLNWKPKEDYVGYCGAGIEDGEVSITGIVVGWFMSALNNGRV